MINFYLLGLKKIIRWIKLIFIIGMVYFIIISLFIYFINKDKPKVSQNLIEKNRKEIYKVIQDPQLNKTKEGKLIIQIYRIFLCGTIGETCTDNPKDADKNFRHSFFGFISNLIILPYINPPASGVYWVHSGLQNAGFIPKTYAAEGIGFAAIKPLIGLWKIFRDFAYMLLVLVLITIGFLIMFRMKINPQTVISIENALPKIVISLIFITFSFAIAGFLIDLMYVIIALSIYILSNNNDFFIAGDFQNKYLSPEFKILQESLIPTESTSESESIIPQLPLFPYISIVNLKEFGSDFIKLISIGFSLFNILPKIIKDFISGISVILAIIATGRIISLLSHANIIEIFNNLQIAGFGSGKFIGGIIGSITLVTILTFLFIISLPLILGLLVGVTLLLILFRIFFLLLKAYINIILLIVFSPIILLIEAIPGKSAFSFWFKNLFAEILTFPLLIIFLILGYILVNLPSTSNLNLWTPPFLYNIDPNVFSVIIGMALIILIPDIIKLVKELLGAKGMPLNVGIGTFFAGATAAFAGVQGGTGIFTSLAQMPFIGQYIAKSEWYEKVFGPSPSKANAEALAKVFEKAGIIPPGLTKK